MKVIRNAAVTIVIMFCAAACEFREGRITNDQVARDRLSWLKIELRVYHEKNKTYPATLREMNSDVEGGAGVYDQEDLEGNVRPLEFGKTGTWSFFLTEATGTHGTREDRPAGMSDPQGITIPRV